MGVWKWLVSVNRESEVFLIERPEEIILKGSALLAMDEKRLKRINEWNQSLGTIRQYENP